jgi:hypothetical protein
MEKSNLVQLLQTIDKKELRELRKWVCSPAHNQRQDVIDLFDYLTKRNVLGSARLLEKEKIFEAVYPGRKFNDSEVRQVTHFLFKTTEEFLTYREIVNDEAYTKILLARVYRQKQLSKLFTKTTEVVRRIQEQHPNRNHKYYENEFFLHFEEYNYLSSKGRNQPLNLQEVSDANDLVFLANKLHLCCLMISHQTVFKVDYKIGLLKEVLQLIEQNAFYLKIPAIAIYYFSYMAMTEKENRTHFQLLKEEITAHGDYFPKQELRGIYLLAINYCIGQLNVGATSFVREAFLLYKHGLAKEVFLENDIISRFTFMNIVSIGLRLNEFNWVEKFIRQYENYLEEKHRENFVHFHLARLHFEQHNYNEAMKLLAQSDYDDTLMSLGAKSMLLKMYFELDEYNALDSLLESMRAYLQRKKVMGYHKSNYKHLIHFTKKLLKVPYFDKEVREKLQQEIEQASPLTERQWLLEQLKRTS